MNSERGDVVELVELAEVSGSNERGKPAGLTIDMFKSVKVDISIVVGTAAVPVGRLLGLESGEVVTLDTPVDAPVEVVLDGNVIARGELVAVGDNFGVRITEVHADAGLK